MKYKYTVMFEACFEDNKQIASELERVFKKIKHRDCLIKSCITLEVRPTMPTSGLVIRQLNLAE